MGYSDMDILDLEKKASLYQRLSLGRALLVAAPLSYVHPHVHVTSVPDMEEVTCLLTSNNYNLLPRGMPSPIPPPPPTTTNPVML